MTERTMKERADSALRDLASDEFRMDNDLPVFDACRDLADEVIALREELDRLRGAYVVERGKNEFPLPHYSTESVLALIDAIEKAETHYQWEGGFSEIAAARDAVLASREPLAVSRPPHYNVEAVDALMAALDEPVYSGVLNLSVIRGEGLDKVADALEAVRASREPKP